MDASRNNYSNSSLNEDGSHSTTLPLSFLILLTFLYTLVFILAVCGNILVCATIARRLRFNVTNIFLFNLSIADSCLAIACVPVNIAQDSWFDHWPFGALLCKMVPFLQGAMLSAVAATQLLIACDRCCVALYPMRRRMSRRTAFFILVLLWCSSCGISTPLLVVNELRMKGDHTYCQENWSVEMNTRYSVAMLLVQFFLPVSGILISYVAIALHLLCMRQPGERSTTQRRRRVRSNEKLVMMVAIVSLLFTISHLPRHVIFLVALNANNPGMFWSSMQMPWLLAVWFSVSSSSYNPLIYCWINPTYRNSFRFSLLSLFCCEPDPGTHHTRAPSSHFAAGFSVRGKGFEGDSMRRKPRHNRNPPLVGEEHRSGVHVLHEEVDTVKNGSGPATAVPPQETFALELQLQPYENQQTSHGLLQLQDQHCSSSL